MDVPPCLCNLSLYNMKKFFLKPSILLLLIVSLSSCTFQHHEVEVSPTHSKSQGENVRVALVLSGAGAKAIVHAGVISALEKHNIPIDLIVGSSAGSLVGLFYADSKDIEHVKQVLSEMSRKNVLDVPPSYAMVRSVVFNTGAKLEKFDNFLKERVKSERFEDLKVPLVVVGTDVDTGRSVMYNSGPVIPSVLASVSIPGIFEPVKLGDHVLTDGGVAAPVPVLEAKSYKPRIVIAVNATVPKFTALRSHKDLMYRSYAISYNNLAALETSFADIQIVPDMSRFNWLKDFDKEDKEKIFQEGFIATEKVIDQIKYKLSH